MNETHGTDHQWWADNLRAFHQVGRLAADSGIYEAPHLEGEWPDPQHEDENAAYHAGFIERRGELAERYKWSGE